MKYPRATFGIIILFLATYLVPLGLRPLAAPDEVRYAEIPREMIASGDWIVPHLNGMEYLAKPVGGYWANAASMLVFGETPFAVRLPSALSIALSALALLALLRFNPDRRAGPFAVVIFLSFLGVTIVGTTAVLDGMFTGWVTVAIVAVFFFLEGPDGRKNIAPLVIAGVATGLAFMTKGFLAFVVPGLALGPYLLIRRSVFRFLKWSWVPLISMATVVLPWSLAVAQRSHFWTHFFWTENVQRFLEPNQTQHVEPWWFYLPIVLLATLPWAAATPAAIFGLRKNLPSEARRLIVFAVCWIIGPLFFFSFSSGKLMPYILPCLPPIALLLATGLLQASSSNRRFWFSLASIISALFGATLLGAVIFLTVSNHPLAVALEGSPAMIGGLIAGGFGWLLSAGFSFFLHDNRKKLIAFALSPVLFAIPALSTLDEPLIKTNKRLIERHIDSIQSDTIVVGDSNSVHSLCWELNRTDVQFFKKSGEFRYALELETDRKLLDIEDFVALVDNSDRPVIAFLERKQWDKYRSYFEPPTIEDHNYRYVLIELNAGRQDRTIDSKLTKKPNRRPIDRRKKGLPESENKTRP